MTFSLPPTARARACPPGRRGPAAPRRLRGCRPRSDRSSGLRVTSQARKIAHRSSGLRSPGKSPGAPSPCPIFPGMLLSRKPPAKPGKADPVFEKNDGRKERTRNQPLEQFSKPKGLKAECQATKQVSRILKKREERGTTRQEGALLPSYILGVRRRKKSSSFGGPQLRGSQKGSQLTERPPSQSLKKHGGVASGRLTGPLPAV